MRNVLITGGAGFIGSHVADRLHARGDHVLVIDNRRVVKQIESESRFGRNTWGLFCLEVWQQEFHDRAVKFKQQSEVSAESR